MHVKRVMTLAGLVSSCLAQGTWAQPPGSSDDQLRAEVAALKQRIAQLEQGQDDAWLNESRAEEVRALVREVLADSEARSSFMQGAVTAGHNGEQFFLASEDGGFLLNIDGQIQVRYVFNSRDRADDADTGGGTTATAGDGATGDEDLAGFEVRRGKLRFTGHIGSPRILYAIQLSVDSTNNKVKADDIAIAYKLTDNFKIWGGEFKAPFLREEMTEAKYQLAIERSLVNEIFTLGYIQGAGAKLYLGEVGRLKAVIHDGALSGENGRLPVTQRFPFQTGVGDVDGDDDTGTDYGDTKPFHGDRTDFAITVRGELKLAGDWEQQEDFSAWGGQPAAVFLGGALHWEDGETGDTAFNNDFLSWTIDGSVEVAGMNLFAAIVGLHTQAENPAVPDVDLYGLVVQGGMMVIPDTLEPFIRFEYIELDNFAAGSIDPTIALLTFGANYYFAKHDAKFSLDVVWALDTIPSPSPSGASDGDMKFFEGLGLLGDYSGEDDQIALRAQFQLLF